MRTQFRDAEPSEAYFPISALRPFTGRLYGNKAQDGSDGSEKRQKKARKTDQNLSDCKPSIVWTEPSKNPVYLLRLRATPNHPNSPGRRLALVAKYAERRGAFDLVDFCTLPASASTLERVVDVTGAAAPSDAAESQPGGAARRKGVCHK
jgi:hypothetical protein